MPAVLAGTPKIQNSLFQTQEAGSGAFEGLLTDSALVALAEQTRHQYVPAVE